MLAPYGEQIVRAQHGSKILPGWYIKHHRAHFVAVSVGEVILVKDGASTVSYLAMADGFLSRDHTWFRLEDVPPPRLSAHTIHRIDANWATAMRRKATAKAPDAPAPIILTPEQAQRLDRNRAEAIRRRTGRACATARVEETDENTAEPVLRKRPALVRHAPPLGWTQPCIPSGRTAHSTGGPGFPDISFLRHRNAHPRDRHIRFLPDTHTYLVRGTPTLVSVTGLVHEFAQVFDAAAIIERMQKSTNWPRPGYLQPEFLEADVLLLASIPNGSELCHALRAEPRDEGTICAVAKRSKLCSDDLCSIVGAFVAESMADQDQVG